MYIRSTLMAFALVFAAFSSAASAAQADDPVEIAALAGTSVSAADAIAAVEKLGSGKVVELTLEASGAAHYAITAMAADGAETNYVVDANTGAVVEVGEAWVDTGDGDGEAMDDGPQGHDQGDGDGETNDDGQDEGDADGETNDGPQG